MPRHPPFALRNLPPQHESKKSSSKKLNRPADPTPKRIRPQILVTRTPARRQKNADLRCSRPLCSSQNTGGTHSPAKPTPHIGIGPRHQFHPRTPSHTRRSPKSRHGPSGPNSVHPTNSTNQDVPNPKAVLTPTSITSRHRQCSTHEPQQKTFAPEPGSGPASWSDAP